MMVTPIERKTVDCGEHGGSRILSVNIIAMLWNSQHTHIHTYIYTYVQDCVGTTALVFGIPRTSHPKISKMTNRLRVLYLQKFFIWSIFLGQFITYNVVSIVATPKRKVS